MARFPRTTRQVPVPGSVGTEMILCAPLPASRGGDGWAGAMYTSLGGGSTTVFRLLGDPHWTAFETTAEAVADRFNGLRLKTGGEIVVIADYDGVDQFTVEPALRAVPAAGQLIKVEADIPLWVTEIMLIADGSTFEFNTMQSGLIANDVRNTVLAGMSHMLVDSERSQPGFNINVLAQAAAATTLELRVSA